MPIIHLREADKFCFYYFIKEEYNYEKSYILCSSAYGDNK